MEPIEEVFSRVVGAHLARAYRGDEPGLARRIAFAHSRWREGERLAGYLAGRYPEVVSPGASLLDLGCGHGGFAIPFAARGLAPCHLVDIHPHGELWSFLRQVRLPVHHLVAEGGALPLADASVDLVLCVETLEHLRAPRRVGREVARVLRPGGLLLVVTPPRLRYLLAREPHYDIRGLLLLPDRLQRWLFERWLHPGSAYEVEHIYWTVAGIASLFPGLAVAEVTSRNWAGPLRRLDWDWIVLRQAGKALATAQGGASGGDPGR